MAAWQTKKQDGYMEPKEIYPNQDICFPYFSEEDMDIVLAEQEHLREMKQLQDEINYELTGRHWTFPLFCLLKIAPFYV